MIRAINKNVLKGDNPFVVGSTVWAVRNGVEPMQVRHIDKLGCDTRLWDLHMDEMFFAYECFPTEEEAKEAYAVALKEELACIQKRIDNSQVSSIFTIQVSEEVLELVSQSCYYFQPTELGVEELIVAVATIEEVAEENDALESILRIATRARCTYLHLKIED